MRSVFLLALLAAPAALAQPGALDPTLGDGAGFVVSEYGGYNEPAVLLLQPDGLAVLVGYGFGDIKIARYLPDGTLDAAFGTGGTVTYDSGYDFVRIAAAALQPDGKIVMAGGGGGSPLRMTASSRASSRTARLTPRSARTGSW